MLQIIINDLYVSINTLSLSKPPISDQVVLDNVSEYITSSCLTEVDLSGCSKDIGPSPESLHNFANRLSSSTPFLHSITSCEDSGVNKLVF